VSERRRAIVLEDGWAALRRFTPARIALGRAGPALPTAEVLRFGLAHARARDAVHAALDAGEVAAVLGAQGHPVRVVRSAAPDRATYLARPDLGRRLEATGAEALAAPGRGPDALVVVADGLSALAVRRHAAPLLRSLAGYGWPWVGAPVVVALQARVALGDEAGERVGARLVLVLVGERPGLSSPDSLGAYVTFAPRRGRTDAERECVSNIRPEGLSYVEAAERVDRIAREALRTGRTGVARALPPAVAPSPIGPPSEGGADGSDPPAGPAGEAGP